MKKAIISITLAAFMTTPVLAADKLTYADKFKLSVAKDLMQSARNAIDVKDYTSACMYIGAAAQNFLEMSHKDKRIKDTYLSLRTSGKKVCSAAGMPYSG